MSAALLEKEEYLLKLVDAIVRMEPNPFPFLCAATIIEYLILISGYNGEGPRYAQFVRKYFPQPYCEFSYIGDGRKDLPEQMWYILRCGLVHSFSMFPDQIGKRKGGRARSILISHRATADGRTHLSRVNELGSGAQADAVLFVLEDLCDDIAFVIKKIFADAMMDSAKAKLIEDHWSNSPPITGNI